MRSVVTATVLVAVLPLLLHPGPRPALRVAPTWPADTSRDSTKDTVPKSDSLPLATTRTVSFDVSEGTWMSLDLSPDGQTIVFELLGDLYTLPVAGGTATRLTSGPAFDSQPRYSPDGKHIVFLSDRNGAENVWICDADGRNAKPVTKGATNLYASPEWTPDGNYVVASRTSVLGSIYELWLYHKDGGSGTAMIKSGVRGGLFGGQGWNTLGAAFGADPRYVWVARHRNGFGYDLKFPLWQVAIYDRQTGKTFVQTDLYGSAMRPIPSPDGKWLVYATRYDTETGLRLRNLATGDEKWLAYPVTRDDQESRFTRDLEPGSSWTPDSRALITSYGGKLMRIEIASGRPPRSRSRRTSCSGWDPWCASRTTWTRDRYRSVRSATRGCRPTGSASCLARSTSCMSWISVAPRGGSPMIPSTSRPRRGRPTVSGWRTSLGSPGKAAL